MTKANSKGTHKRQQFDFARVGGFFSIDPITDVCIIGGKVLPKDEQGDLDTDHGREHTLWDSRLNEGLSEEDILNVDYNGILKPVLVAKVDDVATVVAGRRRIRMARVVNRRRVARGEPPMRVEVKLVRPSSDARMLGIMIAENEIRHDDSITAKIDKVKRLIERGGDFETCATQFGVGIATIKNWMAFEDNATDDVKKAVETGKISHAAAMPFLAIKDPDEQRAALKEALANGKTLGVSQREVRQVTAKRTGAKIGIKDALTQKRLLAAMQNATHSPKMGDKTAGFWEGAEEMMKLILGDDDIDSRLMVLLTAVREAAKKGKPPRKARKNKNTNVDAADANTEDTEEAAA